MGDVQFVGLLFEIWLAGTVVLLILAPCYNLLPDHVIESLKTRREKQEDEEWRQRGLKPMHRGFPDHTLGRALMFWVLVPSCLLMLFHATRLLWDLVPNIRYVVQNVFAAV